MLSRESALCFDKALAFGLLAGGALPRVPKSLGLGATGSVSAVANGGFAAAFPRAPKAEALDATSRTASPSSDFEAAAAAAAVLCGASTEPLPCFVERLEVS